MEEEEEVVVLIQAVNRHHELKAGISEGMKWKSDIDPRQRMRLNVWR